MAYKALLDRFDMERGDALTFPREEVAAFIEGTYEISMPVLWHLFRWFNGESEDDVRMENPRDLERAFAPSAS